MDAQPNEQEPAAVWVPIDEVRPWTDNPRKNDSAVAEVAKSIKRFGFGAPLLARRANGEIIAGHTRWKAAKKLGLVRVPVRFLDLDPAEAHLLALADNKVGEIAEWDDDRLAAVLSDVKAHDVDVTAGTGFDDADVEKIVARLDEEGQEAAAEIGEALGYKVLVECADERQQAMLIERLEREGFSCKPLVV